jgi:hypothetical protein
LCWSSLYCLLLHLSFSFSSNSSQVTHDQAERMYFHKEYNAEVECRPTFEQLSHERVVNEANKDVNLLKALEIVVSDRMTGYASLNTALHKTGSSYELLENVDGTLKIALDSLFVFTDQVSCILIYYEWVALRDVANLTFPLHVVCRKFSSPDSTCFLAT